MNTLFINRTTAKAVYKRTNCIPRIGEKINLFQDKESYGIIDSVLWYPSQEVLDKLELEKPLFEIEVVVIVKK